MKMASTQHASIAAMMNGKRRSPKLGFAAISVVAIDSRCCLRRSAASDRDFVALSSGSFDDRFMLGNLAAFSGKEAPGCRVTCLWTGNPPTLAFCSDGCCKDFFTYGLFRGRINRPIEAAISPNGMDTTTICHNTLVVAVLIASVGEGIGSALVAHSRRHLDIGSKECTAISRATEENVGLRVSRIITSIIPAYVDRARDRVY